eukprot:TRINITY_DN1703_c0_g1_i11.p1 TRINITY_DN1703_c0_g1~~TRINITY_DN1703_c0_g1_i11.p1  ORF type:complete len:273 (+),score=119.36 TRINITY_DN1703_c0_g1_i11:1680-2498(+)
METILPESKVNKAEKAEKEEGKKERRVPGSSVSSQRVYHKRHSKRTRNAEDPESKSEPPIDEPGAKASYVAFRSCSANTYGVNPSKLYNLQVNKPEKYINLQKPYNWGGKKRQNYRKYTYMYGERTAGPPKPYRYYEDDPEEHYMSNSDEVHVNEKEEAEYKAKQLAVQLGIDPHKLFWFKKKQRCYWREKMGKYAEKLDKVLVLSNGHMKELGEQWGRVDGVIREMKDEIGIDDNSQNYDEACYEELWRENAKLMKDISRMKREMKTLKQY